MISVGKNAKLQFHWKVSPYDYSSEKMNNLISLASKKYSIKKDNIKIIPEFILLNDKGENISITENVINDIQNPLFQIKLFEEYIKVNNIENCNMDFIKKIDSEINALMPTNTYDKHKRYEIKWIKWSNFLSYGKDNYFDFTKLNGIVLLNGEPANQSGKTTFAIDLLHFLLFGKTDKAATQDKIFNKWLNEETELIVEGCINIDGTDYVIKRILSRPQLKRRTASSKTTQKVEYYKLVCGELEELEDYIDYQQDENTSKTNKIIKDNIGNEDDFDLIICATSSILDNLIEKKGTERGRLLSRWIGLLPIEEKESIAKEKFNNEIKPYLLSNRYNRETLLHEREALTLTISSLKENITRYEKINSDIEKDIKEKTELKEALLIARQTIDENVSKIDINTLNRTIQTLVEKGVSLKEKINSLKKQIEEITTEDYSEEVYNKLLEKNIELTSKLSEERLKFKELGNRIIDLEKGEICPTCGRKLDGVDNSGKINELKQQQQIIKQNGIDIKNDIEEVVKMMNSLKEMRENFILKSKLEIEKSSLEVQIERLRNDLIESKTKLNEYNKNEEAIKKNNEIDIKINTNESILNNLINTLNSNNNFINETNNKINIYLNDIKDREDMISKIKEEEIVIKNWKIYLDMIGKNGIIKMVLRKSLPIINAQLTYLLNDVCDFEVEIEINNKNEVGFYIIKNGIKSDIASCSGFEKTASSLALRFVLAKNSIVPKMNTVILDEVLSRVANENLDKIKNLLDKVSKDYSFIILVTHNEIAKSWVSNIITVFKDENGISHLKTTILK